MNTVSTRRNRPSASWPSPDWSPSIGAGPLLVSARRPPRRPDDQGQPPHRHHRPLRVQVGRRDDARPERQPADEPGRQQDGPVRLRARIYQFNIDTNLDALRRSRLPDEVRQHPHAVRAATSSRTTRSAGHRRLGPDERLGRDHGRATARPRLQAAPSGSPTSAVAARPSPASRDDPFFFDLPGFVEFKKQLLAGSTDLGVLLGGFTGVDTFKGTNVSSIAIEVPNARLGGTGKTVGVWATRPAAIRRGLPAGRADGPPGDQHGVQQHQRREGSGQPPAPER